jgi:hypothetical protein
MKSERNRRKAPIKGQRREINAAPARSDIQKQQQCHGSEHPQPGRLQRHG